MSAGPSVVPEVERALFVSEPSTEVANYHIHPTGDLIEVYLNLLQWNREIATAEGKRIWGRRLVTYFVYQPNSGQFAPSKFCAYTAIPQARSNASQPIGAGLGRMALAVYAMLNESTRIMDGNRAQAHLTTHLGMLALTGQD